MGMDDISLKKRHQLYATILTDLSDPGRPERLAVAPGRDQAAAATCLHQLSAEQRQAVAASGLDGGAFLGMYERQRDGILAYVEERQTSGQVEGLNNNARVILKRAYGLKSTESLWTWLMLEVNRAGEKISQTIQEMHELAKRIFTAFCGSYT